MDKQFEKSHPEAVIAELKRQKAALLAEGKVMRGVAEAAEAWWHAMMAHDGEEGALLDLEKALTVAFGQGHHDPAPEEQSK